MPLKLAAAEARQQVADREIQRAQRADRQSVDRLRSARDVERARRPVGSDGHAGVRREGIGRYRPEQSAVDGRCAA